MDNENPSAQGQQPVAENTAQPTENQAQPVPQAPVQSDGIQRRFDELTARFHEAERARQAAATQNQELMQMLLSQQHSRAPAPPQDPQIPDNVDPEMRQLLEAYTAPLKRQLAETQVQYGRQLSMMQLRQEAAQAGYDNRVVSRAEQLLNQWSNQRLQGWNPGDALTYAAGELFMQEKARSTQLRDERGRFNSASNNLVGNVVAPPQVNTPPKDAVPADIDSWDLDKQSEFYERRLTGKSF